MQLQPLLGKALPRCQGIRSEPSGGSLYRYAVYGLTVASDEPLVSLEPIAVTDDEPAVTIAFTCRDDFTSIAAAIPHDDWVAHAVLADGSVYLRADKIFESVVSRDGRWVSCAPLEQIDRRTFEANLANFVLATALTLQGEEPLHATVVDLGGRAVGLFGPSGAGKSTLAAFLISRGADLITDDMLRIESLDDRLVAHRGPYRLKLLDEPGRRFLPDALAEGHFNTLTEKVMVRPRRQARAQSGGVPLAGLFYLGLLPGWPQSGSVSTVRLSGVELAHVILSSAMDYRYKSAARLARHLAYTGWLSRALPVHALHYPRRYDMLEEVEAELLRTIGS
jgi:hypothetical protein